MPVDKMEANRYLNIIFRWMDEDINECNYVKYNGEVYIPEFDPLF